MQTYKNRIFDAILRDALDAKGAVLIEGAKWCGKTTTAEQIAKSIIYVNDPKHREQYLMTAQTNPQRLLAGANLAAIFKRSFQKTVYSITPSRSSSRTSW